MKMDLEKKTDNHGSAEFIRLLEQAGKELEVAIKNFNYADTPEIVDFWTYQITVAQARYDLLLKKAQEERVSVKEFSSFCGTA